MRRNSQTKRRWLLGAFGMAVAPLVLASVAHACTQLTNLSVNPKSGPAGVSVELSGSNYRVDATSGPVEIRLNSRSGPVIASLPTSAINPAGRTITLTAPIPASAAAGYQTLIATQVNTSTGALLSGFPVRAAYKVTAPAAGRTSASAPDAAAEPAAVAGAPTEPRSAPASPVPTPAVVAPATSTGAAPAGAVDGVSSAPVDVAAPAGEPVRSGPTAPSSAAPAAPLATGAAAAGTAVAEAAALPPARARSVEASAGTVSRGLSPIAAGGTEDLLPKLTLGLGLALVLLSLAAFLKSGRTVLVGRRPASVA